MKIRIMTTEDFNSMYTLWQEVGLAVGDLKSEQASTNQMINLNPSSNFVAIEGEKIVGTIFGIFNGRRAWIYHLAIHSIFQKRGLGSILLNKAEQALKKLGAKRVLLWVNKDNLGVTYFYQKYDYSIVDDAIVMGKNL